MRPRRRPAALALLCGLAIGLATGLPALAAVEGTPGQVLAFYYGWYGNPDFTGRWLHWKGVDPAARQIANTAHFPELGAYDSQTTRGSSSAM